MRGRGWYLSRRSAIRMPFVVWKGFPICGWSGCSVKTWIRGGALRSGLRGWGGNVRMGVFATRAQFRPNPIGLSAVRLERVELHPLDGPVLHLSGVDLVDGTPILDIKPYVPLADCIPEASEGFTAVPYERLDVEIPESFGGSMSPEERSALEDTLSLDPRPQYQDDPERVYGLLFSGWEVKFKVEGKRLCVLSLERRRSGSGLF